MEYKMCGPGKTKAATTKQSNKTGLLAFITPIYSVLLERFLRGAEQVVGKRVCSQYQGQMITLPCCLLR